MRTPLFLSIGLAGTLVFVSGCGPSGPSPDETIREFIEVVQQQDLERLRCLTGAAEDDVATDPAAFEAWALSHYAGYLSGRETGRVALDPGGIALVRLFSLGRGTFHRLGASRTGPDGERRISGEVRFGYPHADLSRFTPGTIIYLCGAPPGRVHGLRIPSFSRTIELEVLDSLTLEWTLARRAASGDCPEGWAVSQVAVAPDSVATEEVTWQF